MAVTETIQELLQGIDDAQYGRDMREFIHKGIQKCYEEGSAGETDLVARDKIDEFQSNFGQLEENETASRAYVPGESLIYNNIIYTVKTDIAQGGTFVVGDNIVASYASNLSESIIENLTITHPSVNPVSDECYYYKTGSSVVIHLNIQYTTGTTYAAFARLPEGYRPRKTTEFIVPHSSTSHGVITINTNGYMNLLGVPYVANASVTANTKCDIRFDVFGASV